MTEQYKIVKGALPVVGVGGKQIGHQYLALLDGNGQIIAELNGLAFSKSTGAQMQYGGVPIIGGNVALLVQETPNYYYEYHKASIPPVILYKGGGRQRPSHCERKPKGRVR